MTRSLLWIFIACIVASCSSPGDGVFDIDSADIDRISIERFGESLVLEKDGARWDVVSPIRTRANPETVDNFLRTLENLTVEQHVSNDPADYVQYGVGDNASIVTVGSGSRSSKIFVGRAGKDFETQHVRFNDSEDVHLARGRLNTVLRVDVWRYRVIIEIDPGSIAGASFTTPDGDWRLERTDTAWVLTGPDKSHPVEPARLATWASFFNPLTTDRFAEVTRDLVIEHAQRKISIEVEDGSAHQLQFLDLQGEWGVVIDEDETVYQIFALRLQNLFPDLLTFE